MTSQADFSPPDLSPEDLRRRKWSGDVGRMLAVGAAYLVVGRGFSLPQDHVQAWRIGAWLASAVVYAAHIGYEHFGRRRPARALAMHVAAAVAVGAFALAAAGAIHALSTPAGLRLAWVLAFIVWPVVTGVPAYLGARVAAMVLGRWARRQG